MKNLNDKELMCVDGGGINIGIVAGIVAGVSFLVGIFDGQIKLK